MRILIEICLTVCEWFQECSIQRFARRAARTSERKTIFTFLSQGAVGAVLGLFFLSAHAILAQPSGYNVIIVGAFLFYSTGGAIGGAVAGGFIWALETILRQLRFESHTNLGSAPTVFLKQALRFTARTVIAAAVMTSLLFAFFYFVSERELDQMSYSFWIGFSCTTGTLIGLMTGTSIRTCRALIFGAEGRRVRRNAGSWLSIPFGFLLRALSVLGLLEVLLTLALWISNRGVDQDWFPVREQLPAVECAILYFASSSYLSFRTPRKQFLLLIAAALNLPLLPWIANLRIAGTANSDFLAYAFIGFICLWALYTLGCLIAPESALRAFISESGRQECRVPHGGECRVKV